MHREDKERVVAELTERLRTAETLIVADYRGLTMPQIDALRGRLLEHGARFSVVKNTLTRRAAEAAGVDALLALLEGPSAIAFIESDGDMVAVAKALADSARETQVLVIRGGILQGREISASDVEELAKLPPFDVLRGQVLGAIVGAAHAAPRPRQRTAAEPRRADRRPDRAARRRGRRRPSPRRRPRRSRPSRPRPSAAESEAEAEPSRAAAPEAEAEAERRGAGRGIQEPNQTRRMNDGGS